MGLSNQMEQRWPDSCLERFSPLIFSPKGVSSSFSGAQPRTSDPETHPYDDHEAPENPRSLLAVSLFCLLAVSLICCSLCPRSAARCVPDLLDLLLAVSLSLCPAPILLPFDFLLNFLLDFLLFVTTLGFK